MLSAILLSGCAGVDEDTVVVTPDPSIVTVAHVTWDSETPTGGRVEFGPTDAYGMTTPPVAEGTSHDATLLGLTADATWHYRVVADIDGREIAGADHTFRTDPLPSDVPVVTSERFAPGVWGDYMLLVWFDPGVGRAAAMILDRDGAVVWYYVSEQATSMSARFSEDGLAVVLLLEQTRASDAKIVRVPLDGSPITETAAPGGHHDFRELGDGRYAYLAEDLRDIDGTQVKGDRIMEIGPDGSREVWDAFDSLDMVPGEGWDMTPADWTHANGLYWDAEHGRYLLSLYRLRQILSIDEASGAIEWKLGRSGDFKFVDDAGFGPQHAPDLVGDDLLLFDNAAADSTSRLVQYHLDTAAGTATKTWSWQPTEDQRTFILGDARRLPDGATVSAWGDLDEILAIGADGSVVRRVSLEQGLIGKVEKRDSLYPDAADAP